MTATKKMFEPGNPDVAVVATSSAYGTDMKERFSHSESVKLISRTRPVACLV
jgi:hypothetical protein